MSEEDHEELEFNSKLEADTIYEWIKNYHTSNPIPYRDVQHKYLNPKLRSYQERAVTWMLAMEKNENRTARIVNDGDKLVRFEKGGILADEMGLGKTVEVLACILAHPNPDYKKQLEEYIEKMKEDLLKYETGDLRNEDENRENYEENNSREKSKRKTVKNNDIEEVEDDVSIKSSCKLKQKNVYSEILDCTLFENEEKLCENGDKLCEIKDKVRENEEKLCEIQDKLRENMDKVCENEVKLRENEDKLCENEEKLCEIKDKLRENEDKLRGNEDKLRENEEKLCENEDKLREIKDKLRENEDKLCENVYNLREDGYEKLGVSESEKMLREVEESELDEIDKKDNKEFKGVVKNKVRRGTEDKVGLGESVKMETEENKIDAGDTKELDKTMLTNNELEKSEIGSNIEVISRRRARKAVSPKKRKTQRKKNTISDDEDLDFGSPRRVRRKKNNIEDDSEFVCRSASVPDSCSRRSARTKRKLVDDDWFFDDVDDPTTQPSGKLDVGANVSSAVPRRRRAIKSSKSFDADYEPTPTPIKRAKSTKGALMRSELQKMYEALLSETSPAVKKAKIALLKKESDYRCCCLDPSQYISAVTVQCPVCRKLQHRDCVDADASSAVPYVCFTCWPQRALVPSTATLIVAPAAIAGQWSDEIEKHLAPDSNLRVLVYEGVRGGHGYKQPLQLAQYDIVVTTYQVLLKEIDYVSEETDSGPRARRYARKFFAPTSPLTCVEWWRICLDEAQMVERASCKNYSMVSALPAVNRWAVSGTPVQRHVVDLFGLLAFLKVDPYGRYNKTAWSTLERNWRALEELLPQVMWRTSKCDVLTELNVPPQTTIAHWLTFAPVETFFYRKQHALCAALFKQKAQQLLAGQPLTTALRQVSGKQLTALMAPLLRLRQACLHPQLVRGQFVAIKHTLLTMVELLEQMVAKATVDAEEAMRMLVASLNGLAGARLLTGESVEAVNMYRRVLHLAQEYEGRLKMDTLQKIHTMFNLASVLESDGGSAAPPTLRDATLLDDVKAMETDYLNRRLGDVAGNKCALQALADKLPGGCNMLLRCDWWSDMLRHMDTQQLVHKIQVEFEHSKGPLKTLLKKMSGVMALMHELSEWQKSIVETRQSVIDQIKQLEEIPTAVMAGHAVNCHLRNKKPANVDRRCLICRIEHELKQYESLIFWIMNKEDSKSKSKEKQSEEEKQQLAAQSSGVDAKQQSAVGLENLENNTIFEVYNVGTWKPSQHEQIIRLIYNSCSKRMMKREWTEESQAQFSALDTLRKEFRRLRLLWSQISDHVAASDELAMCKLRLRLVTTDEYFANQQATAAAAEAAGSSRRKRKPQPKVNENEKRNVICPLMLDTVLDQLQAEVAVNESALRKAAGTLQYLHNLQKNGDKQTEPCPVCHCQLTDSWSVLKCGHCYCYDCIHTLTGGFSRESIKCAVCRENTLTLDVSHIEARHTTVAHAQIKGSFTTKIEAMVGELLALRAKEPDVKVLIFSVWDGVLNVLAEALELNEIEYCRLSSGSNARQQSALTRFKRESRVCVLLMPLRLGARGLNLTQATHVFLAEPCLNPADLLQAVGRVHRIGQTRETFVHKFAVRGTIEEKMVTAMEGSDSKWAKDKVTVQQLLDLFVPVDNNKH